MPTTKAAPLWFLAMLTLTGTLAMHIFVPVLPLVAHDFHAQVGEVQLTLSVYIIGLAIGQLLYGPIADSIGRRPVLLFGMGLYVVASSAAFFATSLEYLIATRLLQALGGCSGLLLGRAIVRDSTTGNETTKRLSLLNMMVMLGPGLSPIVGGLLAAASGWRLIFAVTALIGLLNLALVWRYIHDPKTVRTAQTTSVWRNYKKLLLSPAFIAYTIAGGVSTTSFYAFLSTAAFIVLHQMHGSLQQVSVYLTLIMLGIWLGCLVANRIIGRISVHQMIALGSAISFGSSIAFAVAVTTHSYHALTMIGPIVVYCFGVGITAPAALTQALGVNPHIAASASGIYGFIQMVIGALCTTLSGLGHDPAIATAAVLLGACMLAQLCFKFAKYRSQPDAQARPA